MGNAAPYSRRELQKRRRNWMANNRRPLALVVVGITVLEVFATLLVLFLPLSVRLSWYLLGLIHAGLIAAALNLLQTAFLAHDSRAIHQLRGAWGEENTREVLQTAKRKGLIWGWVDSIALENGDIDHLVVTRSGNLLAIDSKWRNQLESADRWDVARAAQKAQLRSEALMRTLLRPEGGGHRARGSAVLVTPVVVLWGAIQRVVPSNAQIEGVTFIAGRKLVPWLRSQPRDGGDQAAAADLLRRVEDFCASVRNHQASR